MSSLGTVSKQLSSDDEEFFDADELGSIKQFISLVSNGLDVLFFYFIYFGIS